jgi:hypothetical protein
LPKSESASALSGLVRIGKKYQFDQVVSVVVDHISLMWPKYLHEWDLQESMLGLMQSSPHVSATQLRHATPEPASAIMFAMEFDVPSVLPAAFYMLSTTPSGADWTTTPPTKATLYSAARYDLLDGPAAVKLLRGRDRLRSCIQTVTFVPDTIAPYFCNSRCQVARKGVRDSVSADPQLIAGHPHCLRISQVVASQLEKHPNLCETCRTKLDRRISEARSALWAQLPKYFEIEGLSGNNGSKKRKISDI